MENTNRHDRQRKLMNAVVTRRHTTLSTTLGDLLAVAEDLDGQDALIGLYFPAHWHPPADGTIGHHVPPTGDRLFTTLAGELAAYLSGSLTTFTTPVRTHGDAFPSRFGTAWPGSPTARRRRTASSRPNSATATWPNASVRPWGTTP